MTEIVIEEKNKKRLLIMAAAVFVLGFFVRLLYAWNTKGHTSDMNCFIAWSDRIFQTGCRDFYSEDVFTDYPPGYMYVLYLLGALRHIFAMGTDTAGTLLLMKLPAIVCDMITALFVYRLGKRWGERAGIFAAAVFLLNPAILINSAVWGQVDSIFTLFVVLACYLVMEEKLPLSYFVFAAGILVKPQTLIFTPVILFGVFQKVYPGHFDLKEFSRQALWAAGAVLSLLLGMAPFGVGKVITQYIETVTSYPYATVNAYNLWNLLGLNWASQEELLLFLPLKNWGTIGIAISVAAAAVLYWKGRGKKECYFVSGAVLISGMFLFSVRMHERYLYPVLALLLCAYVVSRKKEWLYSYVFFSAAHFLNVWFVLYHQKEAYSSDNFFTKFISAFTLCTFVHILLNAATVFCGRGVPLNGSKEAAGSKEAVGSKESAGSKESCVEKEKPQGKRIHPSDRGRRLDKKDYLCIAVITLLYSLIALYDLGDRTAPESFWSSGKENETVTVDFGQPVYLSKISWYLGYYPERKFYLEAAGNPAGPYHYVTELTMDSVFSWGESQINDVGQCWRITALDGKAVVGELVFTDDNGKVAEPVEVVNGEGLFDEAERYPGRATFRNSTYFDEIYHARTAYEYIHGLYSYENTHPPLGKVFISLGIRLFGMNPFGWRIIGAIFGILMVPVLYLLANRLFKKRFLNLILTLLFAFDFMHFAQTRIATIDVYVTFFIMLMYYFMYSYLKLSFYDTKLEKTWIPLGLSGICMGLGVASKWTGVYAGAGLAVLFFYQIWIRYREYRLAAVNPEGETAGISHAHIQAVFKKNTIKTILFCILFFVLIPAGIYILSYLPFRDGTDRGLFMRMFENQKSMFEYHSDLEASHPYSSWWYQWPTMYRPIWYYSGTVSETVKEGISAFGNPLVWWMGIPSFFCLLYQALRKKSQTAGVLCVSYLAQYMPWFFVTRITFIYHYFPSVPFAVLMIGYNIKLLMEQEEKAWKTAVITYTALALILFAMFYPVLSGQRVSVWYVEHFLRWFDSWVLI